MVTILTVLAFNAAPAPLVATGQAARLAAARADLNAAVRQLDADPKLVRPVRTARRAMREIRRLVDASYHAVNLRVARPAALALRQEVALTLGGPDAVLVLRDDVLHFRPHIHRTLATVGSGRDADHHRRAATAAAGNAGAQGLEGYTVERSTTRGK